jgi:asparagine synthase (glutamine-hydrolysing)
MQHEGRLLFGSELKAILAYPGVPRRIDLVALNEYLSYEYVPTPRTILRDIHRLPPGHWLLYGPGEGLRLEPYWDLRLERSEWQPPVDWRDYQAQLDAALHQAVAAEMVSDVPVGVLLSGGLDSSTVAAGMVRAAGGSPVDSFSIAFEDASFDESGYARQVAQHLGTRHHELKLTGKTAAELTAGITDFLDEPFADSSLIPTYLLSKFAREHVKVVLGGDGGDEMFAGYPTFTAHRLIQMYERVVPRFARSQIIPRVIQHLPVSFNNISFDFKVRRFLSGRGVPLQARHHRWLGAFVDEQKAELLQDWIKPVLPDTYSVSYAHAQRCDAHQPLNQLLYNDVKTYLEGDILYKVDRSSMAASLEVRVPLLNPLVVDLAMRLPFSLKLKGFTGKYLLKKTMARYLPREIIQRPKKGFNMPVARWFHDDLRPLLLDMLAGERLRRQGFFEAAFVQRLLDDHLSHRRDQRKELWTLLIFQLWYDQYVSA